MTCYKGELTVLYIGVLNETWDPDHYCDDLTEAPCIGDQEMLHVDGEEMELAAEAKRSGQYLDEDAESVCITTFLDGGMLVENCGAPLIPARAFAVGVLELSIFASSFEPEDVAGNTKAQPDKAMKTRDQEPGIQSICTAWPLSLARTLEDPHRENITKPRSGDFAIVHVGIVSHSLCLNWLVNQSGRQNGSSQDE